MIAGPYRSGTNDDPVLIQENLNRLESVALPLFRLGHIPVIGEWLALPLLKLAGSKNTKIIDVRHDTMFNKITNGAKYNYKHLKDAVNFFWGKGIQEFESQFPDKKIEYTFISENSIDALQFADQLAKNGYKINWIPGGMQEWEWYVNNVETFQCMDYLVK